ncbi:MAG TPA: hypothetical protein VGC53_19260 [Vicinamibacteria bacterium]|jgi:hypothetical protein
MRTLFLVLLLLGALPVEGSENPEARALYEKALSSWKTRYPARFQDILKRMGI